MFLTIVFTTLHLHAAKCDQFPPFKIKSLVRGQNCSKGMSNEIFSGYENSKNHWLNLLTVIAEPDSEISFCGIF